MLATVKPPRSAAMVSPGFTRWVYREGYCGSASIRENTRLFEPALR